MLLRQLLSVAFTREESTHACTYLYYNNPCNISFLEKCCPFLFSHRYRKFHLYMRRRRCLFSSNRIFFCLHQASIIYYSIDLLRIKFQCLIRDGIANSLQYLSSKLAFTSLVPYFTWESNRHGVRWGVGTFINKDCIKRSFCGLGELMYTKRMLIDISAILSEIIHLFSFYVFRSIRVPMLIFCTG